MAKEYFAKNCFSSFGGAPGNHGSATGWKLVKALATRRSGRCAKTGKSRQGSPRKGNCALPKKTRAPSSNGPIYLHVQRPQRPKSTAPVYIERPSSLHRNHLILSDLRMQIFHGAPQGDYGDAWVRRLANMGSHVNQARAQSFEHRHSRWRGRVQLQIAGPGPSLSTRIGGGARSVLAG